MKIVLAAINAKYIHANLAVCSLRAFSDEYKEQIQIKDGGVNVQIMLSEGTDSGVVISKMSRDLGIDLKIVNGEMERYRDRYLGSLIINFPDEHKKEVERYLENTDVIWRYYEGREV